MDENISRIAPSAPASAVDLSTRDGAAGWLALLKQAPATTEPEQRAGAGWAAIASALAPDAVPEPVRPGDIGRDGRFEKFVQALQALQLELGGIAARTDQAEQMRVAADRLTQPVPPITGPAIGLLPVALSDPPSLARGAARILSSDVAAAEPGIASADARPASAGAAPTGEPAARPSAVAAGPLPGDRAPDA
jgi:hypothetical protein